MARTFRGLEAHHEVDQRTLMRDTRPTTQKIGEALKTQQTFMLVMMMMIVAMFMFPAHCNLILILAVCLYWFRGSATAKDHLPFRMPVNHPGIDWGTRKPGGGYGKAEGVFLFGNEFGTFKELWGRSTDVLTHILAFGTTGSGKALPLWLKIHTPHGWVKNGDIRVGDTVTTEQGGLATVIGVYPQGMEEVYTVTFEDGRQTPCSFDHLWGVLDKDNDQETISTKEIAQRLEARRVVRCILAEPIEACDSKKQPLNPYLFGFILAGYNLERHAFHYDLLREEALSDEILEKTHHEACVAILTELGVYGVSEAAKFLPDVYQPDHCNIRHRWQLLQGLLDVASVVNENHEIVFTCKSSQLAEDVQKIVWSLGGIARLDVQDSAFKVVIRFEASVSEKQLFQDEVKREQYVLTKCKAKKGHRIVSVEKTGYEETQCIKLNTFSGLFITEQFVVTHNTEFLVSLAFNSLAQGSGLFYIDPKAAPKLQAQMFILCRFVGRDDDFRTINYLTRGKSDLPGGVTPLRTTNTVNPFTYGNAEGLANMLVSLIPKSEGGNAIFSQNAQSLMRSMMYGLVELRDKGELKLSAGVIREFMPLEKNVELLGRDISEMAKIALTAFLSGVGYIADKPMDKQPRSLNEQHGYARSYFSLALNNMTDTYGHIYGTSMGEVDMFDVVQNRRILVTLLPALALAPEELKNLGVISLSSVKNAISIGLGDGQEGTFEDMLYSLPTDAPAPFLSITDEYAAIPTPGYIEVLTQGRGLGIAAIVASQDYAGITKADAEGAQQMLENSKFKFALKMESATDTWEMFKKIAGDVSVMETGGSSIDKEAVLTMNYIDDMNARSVERCRINLRDLQEQIEGEFHAFFNGGLVRGQSFFANPPLPKDGQIRIPQLVQVFLPDPKEIDVRFGKLKDMVDMLISMGDELDGDGSILYDEEESDQVSALTEVFRDNKNFNSMETAICALVNWVNHQRDSENAQERKPINRDQFNDPDDMDDDEGANIDFGGEDDDDDFMPPMGGGKSGRQSKPPRSDSGANMEDLLKNAADFMSSTIVDDKFDGDMLNINKAAGYSENQSLEKVNRLREKLEKSLVYPEPPKPTAAKANNDKNELTSALDSLLGDIKKRNSD